MLNYVEHSVNIYIHFILLCNTVFQLWSRKYELNTVTDFISNTISDNIHILRTFQIVLPDIGSKNETLSSSILLLLSLSQIYLKPTESGCDTKSPFNVGTRVFPLGQWSKLDLDCLSWS